MRPVVLLAHLALWTSSTHAFFPYDPEWRVEAESEKRSQLPSAERRSTGKDGARFEMKQRAVQSNRPLSERAAVEAARLVSKYAGRQFTKSSVEGKMVKRDNAYDIMEAEDPDTEYSAGVDQDGTDYSYFIEVGIGSKKKPTYMLIDTGAGSSWVMGTGCESEACGLHNLFGPDDSTTLQTSSETFSIAYGSGKVSGKLANDTFNVAGMSFKYEFGLATTTSDQFVSFAFDGILGLSLNTGANQNFLEAVTESHDLDANLFSIALNRADDGTNKGEITFGSINKEKYTGSIGYTSLEDGEDWAIALGDFAYDGNKASIGGLSSYIDTGTSFMFGPPEAVQTLHGLVPGAQSSDNITWTVPCDSDKNLTIIFSDVEYKISAQDWISPKSKAGTCTSNIYGYEVVSGAWLLGDTFLKNVYAIFDKDNRRIGFAPSAITSSSNTSTEDATETSSSSADTTQSTHVSALPDTTASAVVGLGKESVATNTATAVANKASATQVSSASGLPLARAQSTIIFCIITFFAFLV